MQPLERMNHEMADLYWLAFLLTGNRQISIDVAVEAFPSPEEDSFFSNWIVGWSRKIAIAKALAGIREELAASAKRIETAQAGDQTPFDRKREVIATTSKLELERALLGIDVFPRCALVLSIFEGLSPDDVTVLLGQDREFIRNAQAVGLRELMRSLAGPNRPAAATNGFHALLNGVQHA